jgi:hypothetical protein
VPRRSLRARFCRSRYARPACDARVGRFILHSRRRGRAVRVRRREDLQPCSEGLVTGIPAAEVSLQGSQGGWFPDAVSQPHQIYHRARSIVDAHRLARCGLNVGQAELEGPGLKTKNRGRRERYSGLMAGPGHSDLHRERNLVSQIMHGSCRQQAGNCHGFLQATARRSGKLAAGASARRKTPRDNSRTSPASRALYRSRGERPAISAVSVANVGGRSLIAVAYKSPARCHLPCTPFYTGRVDGRELLMSRQWHATGTPSPEGSPA